MRVRRSAMFLCAFAVIVAMLSLASPYFFGALADGYSKRIQMEYPIGSSAFAAEEQLASDGLKMSQEEHVCDFGRAGKPCLRTPAGLLYAGGNPLCSYWLTFSLRMAIHLVNGGPGIGSEVVAWDLKPGRTLCFWEPGASAGRPAVLVDSIRAEIGMR